MLQLLLLLIKLFAKHIYLGLLVRHDPSRRVKLFVKLTDLGFNLVGKHIYLGLLVHHDPSRRVPHGYNAGVVVVRRDILDYTHSGGGYMRVILYKLSLPFIACFHRIFTSENSPPSVADFEGQEKVEHEKEKECPREIGCKNLWII